MSAPLENEPRLIARERGHGQFEVVNEHVTLEDFDRQYVCFSGYFGEYGPELFAAAPDLLEALRELVIAVTYADPPTDFGTPDEPNLCHVARVPVEFVQHARAAIAKATT